MNNSKYCLSEMIFTSIVLFYMFLTLVYGAFQMGLAYDEVFHIPEGLALSTLGIRKLVTAHTPLGHWMAGLSLNFISPIFDRAYYLNRNANIYELANQVLFSGKNNFQLMLFVARLPFIFCAVLTPLYVFLISRSLWGMWAGLTSLILAAFCSSIIGWGRYVYMDVPQACFMIATLAHTMWYLKLRSLYHIFATALFLSLTCTIKYSSLAIVPWIFFLFSIQFFPQFFKNNVSRWKVIGDTSLLMFLTLLFTWCIFGAPLSTTFYFDGMKMLYTDQNPNFPFYFLGEFKPGGWWYYFTVNLFIKTSLTALILFIIALVHSIFNTRIRQLFDGINSDLLCIVIFLVPGIMFLVATSMKAIPIGSRYIIPCLPIIYVICGYSAQKIVLFNNKLLNVFLFLILSLHAFNTAKLFPDEMAYFNEFIGSPTNGAYWANDSSIDAGQNLPRLAAYLRSRGNPQVKMLYQGQDRTEMYGINKTVVTQNDWDISPSPGLYAISANWLIYGQKESIDRPGKHVDWLKTYTPIKRLGGSIWIYEFK